MPDGYECGLVDSEAATVSCGLVHVLGVSQDGVTLKISVA
jgi:hypothetical protein